MRIALMIGVALGGLLLSSCTSTGTFIADTLPEWAGGLPRDAPPRRGQPGYQAYIKQIDGDTPAPASAAAAQTPTEAARSAHKPPQQIHPPVH